MEEADRFSASTAKRFRPMDLSIPARPSIFDSQVNSDEDDDASRFSAPPPPPTEPVPPELVCRYPNKPCPQERATKKHGELHSYCAYHRFKAQQYQRKLEQKKRERRQRGERSPSALMASTTIASESVMMQGLAVESTTTTTSDAFRQSPQRKSASPTVRRQSIRSRTRSSPPRPSSTMYGSARIPDQAGFPSSTTSSGLSSSPSSNLEPFHHPVSLQEDDIQLLQVLFMDSPPKTESSASGSYDPRRNPSAPRPTAPRGGSGNASYAVDLDGFTFTSESL